MSSQKIVQEIMKAVTGDMYVLGLAIFWTTVRNYAHLWIGNF